MSSNVIAFPLRTAALDGIGDIDLVTAVDVVIRDLREILRDTDAVSSWRITQSLLLLEKALDNAGSGGFVGDVPVHPCSL
jgi:hypothetical protein